MVSIFMNAIDLVAGSIEQAAPAASGETFIYAGLVLFASIGGIVVLVGRRQWKTA